MRRFVANPPFKAYLFDLDGTLIDSVELILQSYRHTVKKYLGKVPPDELWLAGMGTPLRKQLGEFSDDPEVIEAMIVTYREYNNQHHDDMVTVFPGALETVKTLRSWGVKLGVVTSKFRSGAQRGLKVCGFGDLFPVLVGADDVERPKPDPSPVLHAIEQLGVEPSETVFIGDSAHDLAAGRAAGVSTGAALWGPIERRILEPHEPDYWLETPGDVVSLPPPSKAD